MKLLESKDEVEQLDLVIRVRPTSVTLALAILTRMDAPRVGVRGEITRKVPCPNMKVLRLQFDNIEGATRREVSESCRWMMRGRRSAGYFIEKCYIWWHYEDWNKAASFVLVMENEVVRTEEMSVSA